MRIASQQLVEEIRASGFEHRWEPANPNILAWPYKADAVCGYGCGTQCDVRTRYERCPIAITCNEGLVALELKMRAANKGAEWVDIVDAPTVEALIAEIKKLRAPQRTREIVGINMERDFAPALARAAEVDAIPGGAEFRAFAAKCFEVVPQPGHVETIIEDWHFLSAMSFVGHLLDDEPRIPRRMRVELIARVAAALAMCCAQERGRK